MKKFYIFSILIVLSLGLISCGKNDSFDTGKKVSSISLKSISGENITIKSYMKFEEIMKKIGYKDYITTYFDNTLTYKTYTYDEEKIRNEEYDDNFKDSLTILNYITSYEDGTKYLDMDFSRTYDYNPEKISSSNLTYKNIHKTTKIDTSTLTNISDRLDKPYSVLDCFTFESTKLNLVGHFEKDIITSNDINEYDDYEKYFEDYSNRVYVNFIDNLNMYEKKISTILNFPLPIFYSGVKNFDPYDYYKYKCTLTDKYIVIEVTTNFPIGISKSSIYIDKELQANKIKAESNAGNKSKMIIALDYKNVPEKDGKYILPMCYYYVESIDNLKYVQNIYYKQIREKYVIDSLKDEYDEFINYCKTNNNYNQ
jgi:hypothetical protein